MILTCRMEKLTCGSCQLLDMKLQTVLATICLSVVWITSADADNQAVANQNLRDTKLFIAENDGGKRRLTLLQGATELAAIDIPNRITKDSLVRGIKEAVWTSNKNAVAVAFQNDSQTFAVVFVQRNDDGFKASDVSAVEAGNFGKLGSKPGNFQRFETKPTEWLKREDGLFQVVVQTKAWDASGKAQAAREPLIIRNDGTPLFR